ncbi:MAG TPA: PQQ-dependent sugar dehydrogenase [Mucilaginibacter sp.]|jgi:cytochrome c|nr:PQQ-dependent sugar dehydrogenase [Mucilaginibacter sp.]
MRSKLLPLVFLSAITTITAKAQSAQKPDDNRFTKVVLAQRVEEPMQFQIMKDGKVIYAERKGKLKLYNPVTGKITVIGQFAVSNQYVSQTGEVSEGEDGLQGVILDPDFDTNHWMYVYLSPAGNVSENILLRYVWDGKGPIDESSKKVVLHVPVQRFECCHVGGGMVFDKQKNLYLSTGDNTFSRASDGFSPLDERPGKFSEDSQKGSSNTNDLRGKILRIHPERDATYTIPKGNLFAPGTPKTRPEIYTMGNRNPWRLTIDSRTGWLFWGEVGPDGGRDDMEHRGPQSYDEFNIAKKPGNYGWPYFVADNKAYRKYDFATKQSGDFFDLLHPVNHSPNNTGLIDLPPAVPALIWEGKSPTKEFPLMDSGSDSAVGGPIFHAADFTNAARLFPAYYEGKWFITDWVRGWINVVTLNDDGSYKSMERFLPAWPKLRGPIDMKFGPQGDLYVLEYGNGYFKDNPEAELIRIEYNGGNRKPQVQASANKTAGAVPLKVDLSSKGTKDFDEGDKLTYQWKITRNGAPFKTINQPNASITFTTAGVYKALLTVTDLKGAKNSQSVVVKAGNEPPVVKFNITAGNSSFFFPGKSVAYDIAVNDKEDGSLADKKILPSRVSVSANYLSEGYNMTAIASKQSSVDASAEYAGAIALINKSDCKSCHSVKEKVLGPAFVQVAEKYKGDPAAPDRLVKKIISGGSGVWGDAMMAAHPTLAESDGKAIVKYILSLAYPPRRAKSLPVKGTYTTTVPEGENTDGSFILRAAYTDRGNKTAAAQTGESVVILHAPLLPVSRAIDAKDIAFNTDSTVAAVKTSGAWLKFNVDLTGIKELDVLSAGGGRRAVVSIGTIEVYAGSPQGKLLGKFAGDYDPKGMKISLPDGTTGVTDLYFVFTGAPLRVNGIKFSE